MLTWYRRSKHTFWLCRKQIRNICHLAKASELHAAVALVTEVSRAYWKVQKMHGYLCLLTCSKTWMKSSLPLQGLFVDIRSPEESVTGCGWKWGVRRCPFTSHSGIAGFLFSGTQDLLWLFWMFTFQLPRYLRRKAWLNYKNKLSRASLWKTHSSWPSVHRSIISISLSVVIDIRKQW